MLASSSAKGLMTSIEIFKSFATLMLRISDFEVKSQMWFRRGCALARPVLQGGVL